MSYRIEKFASNLKHCLAEILLNHANDPSFKPDLKKVRIYISTMEDIDQMLIRLNKAKGFLRKNLAERLYVKQVPDLIFAPDQDLKNDEKNGFLN